jgi:phage tail sheath gpL-like
MSVAFDQIPLQIYTPGVFVEFDPSRAVKGVSIQPHDVLIIGQKTSSGSATSNAVNACDSVDEAKILAGEGSQAARMVAAYKAADPLTQVYLICVPDNGSGVAATGNIVWTGTATETGELALYVGGVRVSVAVTKGDTAATVETAAVAAFALVRDLPVTVAADAASGLDFTARCKGTQGNGIIIGHSMLPGERAPAGIVPVVTLMASGATDPDYTAAVTAMADDQYHTVVAGLALATPVGLLTTELESRWGPMRANEGQLFVAKEDTRANLTTLGNTFNSWTMTLLGVEVSALLAPAAEIAASVAGLSAKQTQVDPSRALTGLVLPGMYGARRGSRWTRAERDILLSDGVSTLTVSADGRLHVDRLVTSYQTNAQSFPDTALQDLSTVRLLAALRYSARNRIGTKFARFKLADDGTPIPPGQPICTPSTVRAELIALFQDWMQLGWVEGLEQYKTELYVERDGSDPNRLNAILPP